MLFRSNTSAGSFSADAETKAETYLTKFGDAILRLAYSYVHNRHDAEDILQETLINILLSNPSFENSAHAKRYMLKTAANLSKNFLKKSRLRRTDTLQQDLAETQQESLAYLWQAVKQLPVSQREAVHLFYEEGYHIKEISIILNRKEPTVRSDLRRGRETLRRILEKAE